MYAHVTNSVVDSVGNPPQLAFHDGRWWDLRTLDPTILEAVGWFPVVEALKPADTPTTRWEPVFTLNGATVVQSWVEVPKTAEQLAADLQDTNRRTIGQMLDQDFTDVQGVLAQTNADLRADPSQEIKIIGRVVRRLIRSERGDFTGTD